MLPEQAGGDAKPAPGLIRNTIGMTIDLDRFGPGDRKSLDQEIIRRAGVALFHGTVEHAYSRSAVGATHRCPRCHAPAQPHCAHFIYATDRGTRVRLAPAGFFFLPHRHRRPSADRRSGQTPLQVPGRHRHRRPRQKEAQPLPHVEREEGDLRSGRERPVPGPRNGGRSSRAAPPVGPPATEAQTGLRGSTAGIHSREESLEGA